MKLNSKSFSFLFMALLLLTGRGFSAMDSKVFDVVPAGDPTYGQLQQLEDAGLLPGGSTQVPLTRFEVAQKIWTAQEKMKEIVVAQADMELPPPPPDEGTVAAPAPGGTTPQTSSAAPAAPGETASASTTTAAGPLWKDPQRIQAAEAALKSLQEAYSFELQLVKDEKSDLTDKLSKAESDEYTLWKAVKGISEYPSISIHGTGRAFGLSQQYYGDDAGFLNPASRYMFSYLDLEPTGSITKEIRFAGILRLGTWDLPSTGTLEPFPTNSSNQGVFGDYILLRRIEADFQPDFMTAKFGDFYESYTPFTIWNRNNLDLLYMPEPVERWDDIQKYESFFDHEPAWPFRGMELGTNLAWPDSNLLEQFKISAFANMITNAFNDFNKNEWYFGFDDFSGWIWSGQAELDSKKWYLGDTSWQIILQGYEVILDEPLDSEEPGSAYSATNASTWAHQYIISSFRPTLKIGLGNDVYAGLEYEGAFSSYQDNKLNPDSITSDYAMNIQPYLQMGDSKVTFHYLNVGPYFYSPLAQTRQDDNSLTPSANPDLGFAPGQPGYLPGYSLYQTSIRNQFFLTDVPRPGQIYSYYDRTMDNTFPYGLATPNREGVGLDFDIETLAQKSLKIKGEAYLVQEISGNIVVDAAGTGYTALDPTASGAIPVRNFTYLNFGPSFDFGPNIGLVTPLEIGTNVRYEQTTSAVGTLDSLGIWGGARVGLFREWEVDGAIGVQNANGTEEGIDGTPMARYSYLFDNTDLGSYKPFTVNGSTQYLMLSTAFRFDHNSSLYLDYDLSWGNELENVGQLTGTLNNQFIGTTYEVKF